MTTNNEEYTVIENEGAETEEKVGLEIIEEDAFEDVEEVINQLSLEKEIDALKKLFEDEKIDFEFNAISNLLTLEDDYFKPLSESFLIKFENSIKENKESFALISKQNNYQLEDFQNTFTEIKKEIYNSDELSIIKKDFIIRLIAILFNAFFDEVKTEKIVSIPYELCKDIEIPKYTNNGDAGMDLYSPEEYTIAPGETIIIPTGIKMAIPKGYAILIQPRSGQSVKTKLRIANTPGLIDSGYRDEIGVIIENIEPPFKDIDYEFDDKGEIHIKSIEHGKAYTITEGQRFAQMRLVEVPKVALFSVESVGEIGEDRGGGFGSSGI